MKLKKMNGFVAREYFYRELSHGHIIKFRIPLNKCLF